MMEVDNVRFMKNLHCVVEEFIFSVKNYFSPEVLKVLDIQKVFAAILKRNELIRQELRSISVSKTSLESNESVLERTVVSELHDKFQKRINKLVKHVFSDFLEMALHENSCSGVTETVLHDVLFSGALKDVISFTPLLLEMGGLFSFSTPFFAFPHTSDSEIVASSFNSLQLSTEFENARKQLDKDILKMRTIGGYSVWDLSLWDLQNVEVLRTNKFSDCLAVMNTHMNGTAKHINRCSASGPFNSECLRTELPIVSEFGLVDKAYRNPHTYRCWEDCFGYDFVRNHIYISEVTPEEVSYNISAKEYQAYSKLVNTSGAVKEANLVYDILNILIGIQSDTFFYDIPTRRFRMKPDVHLPYLSSECSEKILGRFLEAASMYHALHNFAADFLQANEGSVLKGMQCGVRQILSAYEKYIIAVQSNSPTMLFLRNDVLKNAELLQSFGDICGIDPVQLVITSIPKGLGLLSYLHECAWSHRRKEYGIMIAVLLKYAYEPYVSFLNKWMTEGVCEDPYNEFQIVEDCNYVKKRDSLFWKFAYTECIDDLCRFVPPELTGFSQRVLDCGKSIKLLKLLDPDHDHLKSFSSMPPPSLSMVFSFQAALSKAEECMKYIILAGNEVSVPECEVSDMSIDKFYVECQRLVNKKQMLHLVKRKCGIIVTGNTIKFNILDIKKVPQYFGKCPTSEFQNQCNYLLASETEKKNISQRRVFRNIDVLLMEPLGKYFNADNFKTPDFVSSFPMDRDSNFSGKLYDNIGILFSSCGYFGNTMTSDCTYGDTEYSFPSVDFCKQLNMSSYTSYSAPVNNSCNQLPQPFAESWSSFWYDNIVPKDVESTQKVARHYGIKEIPINDDNQISSKNSFMREVALLLVSEYGDHIDDIYSCIKVISFQRLMVHIFHYVLNTRNYVIEKAVMKCIVKEHRLDSLLLSLRNIYFLQDETFSQSLCEPLFSLIMKCKTPGEFANVIVLSDILANAIENSDYEYNLLSVHVHIHEDFIFSDMPIERTDFLDMFFIKCHVVWPLNIIVHKACVEQYERIFSVILEIEFLCWLLSRTWRHLIMTCKILHLDDTPQFRAIMCDRFEMEQFIRVIRNGIHQHLQGPLWKFLEKSLSAERSSIDHLESIHMEYLEKVLARCFLTDDTNAFCELLPQIFHQVYKICNAFYDCEWQKNEQTGQYETLSFKGLNEAFQTFKYYQKVFMTSIMKESLTKKCGRIWDKEYLDFLQTILELSRPV